MAVERVLAGILAWLATAAIHSTVLVLAACALAVLLARVVADRAALAAARERLWKIAIFGGLFTASFAVAGGRAWRIELPGAAAVRSPAELQEVSLPRTVSRGSPLVASAVDEGWRSWSTFPWIELAAGAWLAGVAGGAWLWMRDARKLRKRLRGRVRATSGNAAGLLDELRGLRGASVRVTLSRAPGLTAPITRGILRPEICIPPRAERGLLEDELEAMLAHELAHARRRDPTLLAACRAVEVFLFFQPLLRFARRRLLEEIEIRCDDRAARWTGDPASLASCLAEVATWIVAGSPEARAVAMTGHRSRLEQRVGLLLAPGERTTPSRERWIFAPAAIALVGTALSLPAVAMRASPELDESAPVSDAADESEAGDREDLELESSTMRNSIAALEADYAALASDPGLPEASQELRERLETIGAELRSLRAMQIEVDQLVAEEISAERQLER